MSDSAAPETLTAPGECEHGIGLVCPKCGSGPGSKSFLPPTDEQVLRGALGAAGDYGKTLLPHLDALIAGRDRLWVNADRTVLVRQWATGHVEVALRESPDHTWGPPIACTEERS